jgi:hypothetical protein
MKKNNLNFASRSAFLVWVLVFLVFTVSPVMALENANVGGSVRSVLAPNDDFANAADITAIPYHNTIAALDATPIAPPLIDPPSTKCGLASGLRTVWYKYTPSVNQLVHMDTIGSDYDTYIILWKDESGSLTEIACNDDANNFTFSSGLNAQLTAGINYYIEVAQFNNLPPAPDGADAKVLLDPGELRTEGMTHVFRLVPIITRVFRSYGPLDGYVIESNETSGVGLLKNSNLAYVRIGDDDKKRQYRSILSFDTSTLPDDAVVNFAMINIKQLSVSPGNVYIKLGKVNVDICSPYFGSSALLESKDFNGAPSATRVGVFNTTSILGWYRTILGSAAYAFINRTGHTQLRMQFTKDDNNDTVADYIKYHSGNSAIANKPYLILRYYVP